MLAKLFLAALANGRLKPFAITPIIFRTQSTTLKLLSLINLLITSVIGRKSVFASFGTVASLTNSYIILVF